MLSAGTVMFHVRQSARMNHPIHKEIIRMLR